MAAKPLESGIAGNVDAGVGIVPKTLGEYVAEFQQYYKSTALKNGQGVYLPVDDARREIEMSRLIYEAQRSLDYWEFEEFWKTTGLKRSTIGKYVHIGKLYPSIRRYCEASGEEHWSEAAIFIHIPHYIWRKSEYRRSLEEMWQKPETYLVEIQRRRQIGLTVDPATAETTFWEAHMNDPYDLLDERHHQGPQGQLVRTYFARNPGGEWVRFHDLPEATREVLSEREQA